MEEYLRGITRGRKKWIPNFISALDKEKCIGCGHKKITKEKKHEDDQGYYQAGNSRKSVR